jgi:hypothetical protein
MDQIKKSRTIYHYTDEKGAKGIIESQSIWATHYMHLNDKSELHIFRDVFAEWIKTVDTLPNMLMAFFNLFLSEFLGDTSKNQKPGKEGYIVSFCDDGGDRLSQWRAYGNGRGIALGFDETELNTLLGKDQKNKKLDTAFFGDVSYGDIMTLPEDIVADLEKCAEWRSEEKRKELYMAGIDVMNAAIAESMDLFTKCICRFKHKGFSEEKEVRIVIFVPAATVGISEKESKKNSGTIKFRTVEGNIIVPYCELFEGGYRLPIKQIIIGPSPDIEMRKRTLQILLETNGMDPEIVKISGIPYRGR